MYAYEKMTPKEIMASFDKATRTVMLPPSLAAWYAEMTEEKLPRIERIKTVDGLDKSYREFRDFCHSHEECDDCKYSCSDFGTAECFKRFLEEEV